MFSLCVVKSVYERFVFTASCFGESNKPGKDLLRLCQVPYLFKQRRYLVVVTMGDCVSDYLCFNGFVDI